MVWEFWYQILSLFKRLITLAGLDQFWQELMKCLQAVLLLM